MNGVRGRVAARASYLRKRSPFPQVPARFPDSFLIAEMPSLRAFLVFPGALALALAVSATAIAQTPRVLAVEFENDVNPVTKDYVINAIDRAEEEDYAAVVILLDTPGVSTPRCARSSSASSRRLFRSSCTWLRREHGPPPPAPSS